VPELSSERKKTDVEFPGQSSVSSSLGDGTRLSRSSSWKAWTLVSIAAAAVAAYIWIHGLVLLASVSGLLAGKG
jgi:hypothetical protein